MKGFAEEGFATQIRRRERRAGMLVAAVASLMLGSCASDARLSMPNGSHRVAVNTPASLAQFQDLSAREDATALEKNALQRKVIALSAEVAALKATIEQQAAGHTPHHRLPGRGGPTGTALDLSHPASSYVMGDRVVFRVSESVGRTDFAPAPDFGKAIIQAAHAARTIVIRGRTDAEVADEVESRIALDRALKARSFLVGQGIDASKIGLKSLAAGGFIADNSSPQGRRLNRRVEIEAQGVDTATLSALTAAPQSRSPL